MSLKEIAKKLGVSHTTVSRALNPEKRHLISENMRAKIVKTAEEFRYRPNRLARSLAMGRTHSVGIVLPTLFNSMFFHEQMATLLNGIFDTLKDNHPYNSRVIILPKNDSSFQLKPEMLTDDLEGLLVSSQCNHFTDKSHFIPPEIDKHWTKPVVVLNLEIRRGRNISFVTFSNFDAAKKAVTHLIKKKHRRIALIYAERNFEDSDGRYEGYRHALKEHHIPVSDGLIQRGDYTEESGYAATLKLFNQKGPRPTALFCTNDEMAIGAMRALEALRIRCPQDVAVMGFDGLALGHFVRPRLSSVSQPLFAIAKTGTQLLIDLIEKKIRGPQAVMIPSELVLRDSA